MLQARSRKLLSNVLVDLHRAVGDYIVVSRNALAFDHDRPHWLDVDVFRSRLMTTLEDSSSGDLHEAIALYRDELPAGVRLSDAPGWSRGCSTLVKICADCTFRGSAGRSSRAKTNAR